MSTTVRQMRERARLEAVRDELRYRAVRDDVELFCETCVTIERKDSPTGYGLMKLMDHQRDFITKLKTSRKLISVKGRQIGLSTVTLSFLLWRMIAAPGFKALYLSHKDEYAKASLERLRLMFHQLPAWLKDRLPTPNDAAGNFTLDYGNGVKSVIVAMPVTKKVGASMTLDCVVFDEAALAEYASDAYASLAPTLDAALQNPAWTGAVIVVISTARGATNWFAQTYRKATDFAKVFYPWHVNPFYTQDQYDRDLTDARARGEEHLHFQERPANPEEAFRKSGVGRFPMAPKPEDCGPLALRGVLVRDEDGGDRGTGWRFEPRADGELRIAELPDGRRPYFIGADVAHGKKLDYTVFTVTSYDDDGLPFIAAYWRANDVEPYEAAHALEALGYYYGQPGAGRRKGALVGIEKAGGHGDTFVTVLRGRHYPNLYRYTPQTQVVRRQRMEYGVVMSKTTKPVIVDNFAQLLPTLGNVSDELALELAAFVVKENGSQEADAGAHDDLVDSAAISCWLLVRCWRDAGLAGLGAPAVAIGEDDQPESADAPNLRHLYTEAAKVRSAEDRTNRRAMAGFRRASRRR